MMFRGAKFCQHCGAQAKAVEVGRPTHNACPRCLRPLLEVRAGAFAMEQCAGCSGLWMPLETFDQVCADAEASAAALQLSVSRGEGEDERELSKYPKCPTCADAMGRVNYARRSGVFINICRAHGVWLDRDELRAIVEFIRSGGLDRARAVEMERLEAARRKLSMERRLRDVGGDNRPRPAFPSPMWWLPELLD